MYLLCIYISLLAHCPLEKVWKIDDKRGGHSERGLDFSHTLSQKGILPLSLRIKGIMAIGLLTAQTDG